MTRNGHRLTNAAVAFAIFAWTPTFETLPLSLGVLVASSAPDDLELSKWQDVPRWHEGAVLWVDRVRTSIIPHRTVTHWVLAWIVLLTAAAFAQMPAALRSLCEGVCIGALVHLAVDALSPSGIPWWLPMRRTALQRHQAVYNSTDASTETPLRIGALLVLGAALLLAWMPLRSAAMVWASYAGYLLRSIALASDRAPFVFPTLFVGFAGMAVLRKLATTSYAVIETVATSVTYASRLAKRRY